MTNQVPTVDDDLTDEERASLEHNEPEGEADAIVEPDPAPQTDPAPAAPEVDPDLPPAVEPDAAPAEPAPAVEPEPEAKPEPVKQEAAPVQAPILIVQAPEDAKAKLEGIATQKAELVEKFEDGEVTAAQFHTQMDSLSDQQFDIKSQVREAELASKLEGQRIQNTRIRPASVTSC